MSTDPTTRGESDRTTEAQRTPRAHESEPVPEQRYVAAAEKIVGMLRRSETWCNVRNRPSVAVAHERRQIVARVARILAAQEDRMRAQASGWLAELIGCLEEMGVSRSARAFDLVDSLVRLLGDPKAPPDELMALRRLLWLRHGCPITALYGDDGEMQCGACGIDFKRLTAAEIEQRFVDIGTAAAKEGS